MNKKTEEHMNRRETDPKQPPLAIIGIGCLFPKAQSLREYWANIRNRVDGVTDVPATHWNPNDFFDGDPKRPDMTYGRRGGFLDPVQFDAAGFGISPNNVPATDPAQLLGLIAARQAFNDAGYGTDKTWDRSSALSLIHI